MPYTAEASQCSWSGFKNGNISTLWERFIFSSNFSGSACFSTDWIQILCEKALIFYHCRRLYKNVSIILPCYMTESWVSFWGLRHTWAFVLKLLTKAKRFNLDDITNDVHISVFKWCVGVMSCSPGWDSRLACKFSCWGSCWWLWRCDQLSSTGSFKKNPRRPAYKHHHDLNLTVNCTQKWRVCRKDAVFGANIPTAAVCQAWPWICSIKYWIQVTIGVGWGFQFPVLRKV